MKRNSILLSLFGCAIAISSHVSCMQQQSTPETKLWNFRVFPERTDFSPKEAGSLEAMPNQRLHPDMIKHLLGFDMLNTLNGTNKKIRRSSIPDQPSHDQQQPSQRWYHPTFYDPYSNTVFVDYSRVIFTTSTTPMNDNTQYNY